VVSARFGIKLWGGGLAIELKVHPPVFVGRRRSLIRPLRTAALSPSISTKPNRPTTPGIPQRHFVNITNASTTSRSRRDAALILSAASIATISHEPASLRSHSARLARIVIDRPPLLS
jgi:hypothetical protein